MESTRQPWKKGEILELLDSNDKAVCRALVRLYERQTETEKEAGTTKERNGRGFNGRDAAILTSIAQFYGRTGYLSRRQVDLVRKKIVKYVGQLVEIANEKIITVNMESAKAPDFNMQAVNPTEEVKRRFGRKIEA